MADTAFARLREVFETAIDLPPAERPVYLARECAGQVDFRERVEALLSAAEADDPFLSEPTAVDSGPGASAAPGAARPAVLGSTIGPYTLLEQIGEGGFGVVFLAEQREPVPRNVALKIIKLGMDTHQVISRFDGERRALAMMDHPNIARVLDAGATDARSPLGPGRPYFVMELVKGVPITKFCDEHRLPLRERLALFMDACHAVQHAHQKGIIHRDLKPSNVLVSNGDHKAAVKIIDFGIAKATEGRLTDKTLTGCRQMIGTPAYMSPEQAGLSDLDIDTRSDIYALGVLLYELLTGTTPFEAARLRGADLDVLRQIIREEEPPTPSTRVSTLHSRTRAPASDPSSGLRGSAGGPGDLAVEHPLRDDRSSNGDGEADRRCSAIDITRCRRTDPNSLVRSLHGDLDWIVMKSLEKDRTRRYETANGLAFDVERYLRNEPVLAGPPSRLYRLRKFVRRNRALVTAVAMVAAALLLGMAGTTFGLLRAEAARKQTQQVSDFQAEMLSKIDVRAMGQRIKERYREKVQEALAHQYVGQFPDRRPRTPEEVQAELAAFDHCVDAVQAVDVARQVMGEFVLAPAADALETRFSEQPLVQARLHTALGAKYRALGLYGAAETHFRRALEIRKRELGPDHLDTLASFSATARMLWRQGKFREAEAYCQQALEGRRRVLGDDDPATLASFDNMGEYLVDRRPDLAEPYYREALEGRRRVLGDDDGATLGSIHNIGYLLHAQGKLTAAEPYFREALERARRVLGDEHGFTQLVDHNLNRLLVARGRFAEAEPYFGEALEACRPDMGDDHPDILPTISCLGRLLLEQGRLDEAEPYIHEVLERALRFLGDEHPNTLRSINGMGVLLQAQGKPAEAEPYFRDALETSRRVLGDQDRVTLTSAHNLGFVLHAQGKLDEAERYCRQALETRRRLLGDEHPETLSSIDSMGMLFRKQGRPDEARSLFAEGTRAARAGLGDHPLTAMIEHHYADVLREAGDLDEALDLARTAVDRYRAHPDWAPNETAHALRVLAAALDAAGRNAEALAVRWESVEAVRQRPGATRAGWASALATFVWGAFADGDAREASQERGRRVRR